MASRSISSSVAVDSLDSGSPGWKTAAHYLTGRFRASIVRSMVPAVQRVNQSRTIVMELTRREMLTVVAGAGVATLIGVETATTEGEAVADTMTTPPAYLGSHQPKPLPFDPAKLRGLSEKLLRSHHENNYTGEVMPVEPNSL